MIRRLKASRDLVSEKEIQVLQALIEGEERERSRIASSLHDEVSGLLAAAQMQLNAFALRDPAVRENDEFRQAQKLLSESAVHVRRTSHNLMPEILNRFGLSEAVKRYCASLSNKTLEVSYYETPPVNRYTGTFELSVYRIVQELLNNVIRHSNASRALVQLTEANDILSITVEDNGVGFIVESELNGVGLASLRRKVNAMNGFFELTSSPGKGVSVFLEFDVAKLKR